VKSAARQTFAPLRAVGTAMAVMLVVGATLAAVAPASAEQADRNKPISFSGDTGDANLQARGGALTGNVIITQGTLSIRADRVIFKQNADNSLSATAFGNPVAIRQKRDGVDEYYEGYAQRVEYDGAKELVELFDRALLKRGQDEIRSNYVSYNAGTEVFKAEGREGSVPDPTGPGARVRGMFQPRSDTPMPGKDKSTDKEKDKAKDKDKDKDGAKTAAPAAPAPPVTLKAAGDLAPPAAK
jgi:lipopolysaccharide export system protein LptA